MEKVKGTLLTGSDGSDSHLDRVLGVYALGGLIRLVNTRGSYNVQGEGGYKTYKENVWRRQKKMFWLRLTKRKKVTR